MEKQSFREILAGLLEENDPAPKTETAAAYTPEPIPEMPTFHWENTSATFAKPSARYATPPKAKVAATPAPAPTITAAPAAAPVVKEPSWTISELNSTDQRLVNSLVKLGANEVATVISVSLLKKAYRRLAKQLHPDTALAVAGKQKSQEDFLALQSIYEELNASLRAQSTPMKSAA